MKQCSSESCTGPTTRNDPALLYTNRGEFELRCCLPDKTFDIISHIESSLLLSEP